MWNYVKNKKIFAKLLINYNKIESWYACTPYRVPPPSRMSVHFGFFSIKLFEVWPNLQWKVSMFMAINICAMKHIS
jgi:hypothetical protein